MSQDYCTKRTKSSPLYLHFDHEDRKKYVNKPVTNLTSSDKNAMKRIKLFKVENK